MKNLIENLVARNILVESKQDDFGIIEYHYHADSDYKLEVFDDAEQINYDICCIELEDGNYSAVVHLMEDNLDLTLENIIILKIMDKDDMIAKIDDVPLNNVAYALSVRIADELESLDSDAKNEVQMYLKQMLIDNPEIAKNMWHDCGIIEEDYFDDLD